MNSKPLPEKKQLEETKFRIKMMFSSYFCNLEYYKYLNNIYSCFNLIAIIPSIVYVYWQSSGLFNLYPSSGIYLSCLSFILFSYLVYPSLITTTLSIHFSTVQFIVLFSKPNDHLSNLGRNHHHWSTIGDPLSSGIYMTTVVNITAISYPKAN